MYCLLGYLTVAETLRNPAWLQTRKIIVSTGIGEFLKSSFYLSKNGAMVSTVSISSCDNTIPSPFLFGIHNISIIAVQILTISECSQVSLKTFIIAFLIVYVFSPTSE